MKTIFKVFLLVLVTSCISVKAAINSDDDTNISDHNAAEAGIRLVMEQQERDWNNHDLEGFMEGYWKSSELKFYGPNGLTLGWNNTLERYKKVYPTKAESGTLNFVINDISNIESDSYWVMGEYYLKRDVGDADGVFIIIFKKIDGAWKIVADMSC